MKVLLKLIFIILIFITVFAFSQINENYITIDYSSICCGTPSEKPVMDFIKNFEKKYKLNPFEMFIESGLGKEGEHAFYIGTNNLNAKLLKYFWNGLRITASNQNKKRSDNGGGFVNLNDKLTPIFTLKSLKTKPSFKNSSLGIYDYKKLN